MKASQITKDWHVIDAAGRPLGRVATEVATLLRGKHKPTYEPHLDDGDFVIVINASQVRLSGNKVDQKKYRRHSGYPGGLRERTFTEQMSRRPDRVIEQAVWGMLPSGPLAEAMFKHLKVYAGPNHPHQSQIIGSQRARQAREEAAASAVPASLRPRGLRPLGGQQPAAVAEIEAPAPVAELPAPEPESPALETAAAEEPTAAETADTEE
jgi:large subunit ribosomal protein L13